MVTSVPWLEGNQISKNKTNGVMVIKDSRPKLKDNLISRNGFVGLFIRDKSCGEVINNTIQGN